MKRMTWMTICLLAVVLALGFTGCEGITSPPTKPTTSGSIIGQQNTGIWVTGTGKVTVTPDIAILEVGVEAQEATVAEAMAKSSEAMVKVINALTGSGVKKEDIQTQYFSIRERTRWDEATGQEIVVGYRVTNKVTAKIRQYIFESATLDYKASNIIDDVARAGGNLIRIDNFGFSVEDPSAYYDQARELATDDARSKAEKLASQTGVKLGAPTYVSESTYMPPSYEGMVYAVAEGPMPAPAPAPAPSVSPGEVKVILNVQIAYSIR